MTLEELAKKYGTDKYIHGYCPVYEIALAHLKDLPIRLLEVGVDHGWSMHMWRDYLPKAELVGIDIRTDLHDLTSEEATIYNVDCDDVEQLGTFARSQEQFDVIIDDGGHSMQQQQNALNVLWDLLKPGGVFIMEDMHTSLREFYPRRNPGNDPTTLDLIKALEDDGAFDSRFLSAERFDKIKSQVLEAHVAVTCKGIKNKPAPSITSIVRKNIII